MVYVIEYLSRDHVWELWAAVLYPGMAKSIAERLKRDSWLLNCHTGCHTGCHTDCVRIREVTERHYVEVMGGII